MTRRIGILALAVFLVAGSIAAVYAEQAEGLNHDNTMMRSTDTTVSSVSSVRSYQVTETIGSTVKNKDGQDIGTLNDLVFDTNGRVPFVIISTTSVAGITDKKVAIPFAALNYDAQGKGLFVNVSNDQLRNARPWDKIVLQDRSAASDIYRHFGRQPYWEGTMRDSIPPETSPGMRPDSSSQERSVPGSYQTLPPNGGLRQPEQPRPERD